MRLSVLVLVACAHAAPPAPAPAPVEHRTQSADPIPYVLIARELGTGHILHVDPEPDQRTCEDARVRADTEAQRDAQQGQDDERAALDKVLEQARFDEKRACDEVQRTCTIADRTLCDASHDAAVRQCNDATEVRQEMEQRRAHPPEPPKRRYSCEPRRS